MIDKVFLLDGAIASGTTAAVATVTVSDMEPILPIVIGVLAPIIKEALFRLVDNISKKVKKNKKP